MGAVAAPTAAAKTEDRPPSTPPRLMSKGILWLLRTGAPWRDRPERDELWRPVASRFSRWREAGVWQRIGATLQSQAEGRGHLAWETHYLDSPVVRAHPPAAGAKLSTPVEEAVGRRQGGFSTKVHRRAEGHGRPMALVLTPAQRHETTACEALMQGGAVKRPGRRPRRRPRRGLADNAYSSRAIRRWRRQRGIRAVIPRQCKKRQRRPFDRHWYRQRNRIERLLTRCKHFRRLATRYEKRAQNYLARWLIAMISLWL